MAITYTKLKNGDWGVRSDLDLQVGHVVEVTTKAGKVKQEKIRAYLFMHEGVRIYAVEPKEERHG